MLRRSATRRHCHIRDHEARRGDAEWADLRPGGRADCRAESTVEPPEEFVSNSDPTGAQPQRTVFDYVTHRNGIDCDRQIAALGRKTERHTNALQAKQMPGQIARRALKR